MSAIHTTNMLAANCHTAKKTVANASRTGCCQMQKQGMTNDASIVWMNREVFMFFDGRFFARYALWSLFSVYNIDYMQSKFMQTWKALGNRRYFRECNIHCRQQVCPTTKQPVDEITESMFFKSPHVVCTGFRTRTLRWCKSLCWPATHRSQPS